MSTAVEALAARELARYREEIGPSEAVDLQELKSPLKLAFYGRKRHKKGYFTFLGDDAVAHLMLWREKWTELAGRPPRPGDLVFIGKPRSGRLGGMNGEWLNYVFRGTALKLARQGMVENGDGRSWHSHMLRHSFKSEGEHAGVPSDFVELWMRRRSGGQSETLS
jgi:integrase